MESFLGGSVNFVVDIAMRSVQLLSAYLILIPTAAVFSLEQLHYPPTYIELRIFLDKKFNSGLIMDLETRFHENEHR